MLKFIKKFSISLLKEDMRKIGIHLIVAAIISAFITRMGNLHLDATLILLWVSVLGALLIFLGSYKEEDNHDG